MATQLRKMVYLSTATAPYDEEELKRILDKARANNTANGVTGLLIYHDGCFLQVLEGEADVVEATLKRVRNDPRHHGLMVVHKRDVTERLFPDWSMGYVRRSDLTEDQAAAFVDIRAPFEKVVRPDLLTNSTVLPLVDSFLSSFRDLEPAY